MATENKHQVVITLNDADFEILMRGQEAMTKSRPDEKRVPITEVVRRALRETFTPAAMTESEIER